MLDKFLEEKKNRDICLADCDAGAVTVTNITDRAQISVQWNNATDSASNTLVSDTFMIHKIDIDGKFIRFLNIVCSIPMQLALDEDDYLYIADKHGNVKIVQLVRFLYVLLLKNQLQYRRLSSTPPPPHTHMYTCMTILSTY